jgi:CRISPR-associated endonuclease/helicase Cas3
VLHDPFAMHVSRLCLMLADHHYSSITDDARRQPYRNEGYPLYANTVKNDSASACQISAKARFFNQTLDEHLLGVQAHATLVARSLPSLARSLPALKTTSRSKAQRRCALCLAGQGRRPGRQRAPPGGGAGRLHRQHGLHRLRQDAGQRPHHERAGRPGHGLRCAFAIGCARSRCRPGAAFRTTWAERRAAGHPGGRRRQPALFEYWEQQAEASGSASSQACGRSGQRALKAMTSTPCCSA